MRTDPSCVTLPESYAFRFRRPSFFRVTTSLEGADPPAHVRMGYGTRTGNRTTFPCTWASVTATSWSPDVRFRGTVTTS